MLTIADIEKYSLESIPKEILSDNETLLEKLISNASDSIETYLNKKLSPTDYKEYPDDWEAFHGKFKMIPARTPVIDCEGAEVVGNSFLLFDEVEESITYKAGYEIIPEDIKRVCFNLVMFEWGRVSSNSYAQSVRTVVTGSATAEITKAPKDFYADELKRLHKYKDQKHYAVVYELPAED